MNRPRLRVAHVAQPVVDGVPRVLLDLVCDQRDNGWDVHVLSPAGWLADQARERGVPWQRWEATRSPGPRSLAETGALSTQLRSLRPDLVHLHSSKAGLAGRLALRGDVPTVFQPHAWSFSVGGGAQASLALAWERWATRWTSLQICCSPEEQVQAHRSGVGGRSRVLVNGVDLEQYRPSTPRARRETRTRLGVGPDVPVVVCVGRLTPQKGQDVALAAWPAVREGAPAARLLLVGDGPLGGSLRASAPAGVELLGRRDDVPDLLAAADLVLMPSRWEGLALALLEAMATGVPVVASAVAGSASALLAGPLPAAGAVVPVEDPRALAQAVLERLLDPALRDREGRAGRLRVEQQYDLAVTTAAVRAAYAELLDTQRGHDPAKPR